ncbi:MAG: glycosyltransferase [bacterium]
MDIRKALARDQVSEIFMKTRKAVAPFPAKLEANPYCELLYTHIEALGVPVIKEADFTCRWLIQNRRQVKVLHFHWLAHRYQHWRGGIFSFFTLTVFMGRLLLALLLRYRLVWTMHNYLPHESPNRVVDYMARLLMINLAKVIVHCGPARDLIANKVIHKKKISVIPHGNYISVYQNDIGKGEARERLGLPPEAKVFLSFGLIRGYKGTERLIRDFAGLNLSGAYLLIAGQPYESAEEEMIKRRGGMSPVNIQFHLGFIPCQEVQYFFKAADVAVFPFEQILTSGSVILSLSFARPVVVPRLGCMRELEGSGAAILYDNEDPEGLSRALGEALQLDLDLASKAAFELANDLDWQKIAQRHIEAYGLRNEKSEIRNPKSKIRIRGSNKRITDK